MVDALENLGEFGIIDLFRSAARPGRGWVKTGIGDDCAVLDIGGGQRLLVTTDMLVERTHFLRDGITPCQLGHKILAVNLSDIAAMGGEPAALFLAMGLTTDVEQDFVSEVRNGLLACCRLHRVDLLGGDTVACKQDMVFSLTLLGRAEAGEIVTRAGASPGDRVMLGGTVGDSAAGLHLLLGKPGSLDPQDRERLVGAHCVPQAQVDLGRLLGTQQLATAMIDVSDGVLQDLGHLCEESGVGADLDADLLPLSSQARRLAAEAGLDARDFGLFGGEDFVLMFCVKPDRQEEVIQRCRKELSLEVCTVGLIKSEKGIRVRRDGAWTQTQIRGYDHFAKE